VEKLQSKLASWRANLLSKGVRLILIKHVLTMGVLDVPTGVIDKMNSIISNFF
jgi:hypothetical protein